MPLLTKSRCQISIGVLLLVAAISTLGLRYTTKSEKPSNPSKDERSEITKVPVRDSSSTRDPKSADLAAERWYREALARHPYFEIDFKNVPDEDNGFLQLILFVESLGTNLALPDSEELVPVLEGKAPWNSALVADWFNRHPEIIQRLLEISELRDQSVKGIPIPRQSTILTAASMNLGNLLQAHGRVAFEQGNIEGSRQSYAAAINLAAHFDRVETPSLLQKIIAIQLRQGALSGFRDHILPEISSSSTQLPQWRNALSFGAITPSDLSRVAIGEWHTVTRNIIIPELLGMDDSNGLKRIPDPDSFLDAYSQRLESISRAASTWSSLADASIPPPASITRLSRQSQELLSESLQYESLVFGFQADHTRAVMHDAAIAILLGEEAPAEPFTGRAFIWNPTSRVLSPPPEIQTADFLVEPMTLP